MTNSKKCVSWKFDENGSFYITKYTYPLETITPIQLSITNNTGNISDESHKFNNRIEQCIQFFKNKLNCKRKAIFHRILLNDLNELYKLENDKVEIEHEDKLDEIIEFIKDFYDIDIYDSIYK